MSLLIGVGKTSIMKRCCLDDFKDWYTPTKGTDFKFKAIQYKRHSDSMQDINNSHDQSFSDQKNKEDRIKLQIWDTAGQERHINANPDFYQKGLGFILVFSIDDLHSFQNIKSWHQLAVSKGYKSPLVKMCLLGHKSDLASERVSTAVVSCMLLLLLFSNLIQ